MQKEDVFIFKIKVLREDLVFLHGCKIKVIVKKYSMNRQYFVIMNMISE